MQGRRARGVRARAGGSQVCASRRNCGRRRAMKARRIALYSGIGISIYIVTLMATIPAAWLCLAVERVSQQKLEMRAPVGSLWSGSGRLYAAQRSGPQLERGELRSQ